MVVDPAAEDLTPITSASMMWGWLRRTVSSSGGAIWKSRTLMSS